MPGFPNLTVLEHPLIQHKLSFLRHEDTPKKMFKELVDEIAALMAYEVTRDFGVQEVTIRTPLEEVVARRIRHENPVLVPILRAGLGMVEGILGLIPAARVGHIGLYRNEETLQPVEYYVKMTSSMEERIALIIDPMLATGGSLIATIDLIKRSGCKHIKGIFMVAAPEGIEKLTAAHPDVEVYVAAVDEKLNDIGYILPGLGDAGDKIFGTK